MAADPEVELLTSDGGLRKTIIRPGTGPPAGHGALVSLRYSMRLAGKDVSEAFDSSTQRRRRDGVLQFTVGRRKVIYAIERIAESMSAGEVCDVTCESKYAFGSVGLKRKAVPPHATVVVRAEMLSFASGAAEKALAEMTPMERFAKAEAFKEAGNRLFKELKYDKAIHEYSAAIRLLAKVFVQPMVKPEGAAANGAAEPGSNVENAQASPALRTDGDAHAEGGADEEGFSEAIVIDATSGEATVVEEGTAASVAETAVVEEVVEEPQGPTEEEVISLHVRTLNNLSLCCFKQKQLESGEEAASLAIRMDEKNFKAFYYRGRARAAQGKLDEARSDLIVAAKLKPQNMGIRTELDSVEKKIKVSKMKERRQAEAMFA